MNFKNDKITPLNTKNKNINTAVFCNLRSPPTAPASEAINITKNRRPYKKYFISFIISIL
jgi:hypothetical protein